MVVGEIMEIDKLIEYIKNSKKTVFFGGAGVSTASGLQDFRGSNGLYKEKRKYSPEEILSHNFFMQHTDLFYEFYKEKLKPVLLLTIHGDKEGLLF